MSSCPLGFASSGSSRGAGGAAGAAAASSEPQEIQQLGGVAPAPQENHVKDSSSSSSVAARVQETQQQGRVAPVTQECPVNHPSSSSSIAAPVEELSSERVESSIPSANGEKFLYPSEKMFYGAATAKGHQVQAQDMSMVIAIHNAVNERTWQEILKFEQLHAEDCATPKLVRFLGRPGELSPKAKLGSLLGYSAPFDRHDWHVDRCGTHIRYVVDFYDGKPSPTHPVSIFVDARPEASWAGLRDRLRLWARGLGS